MLRKISIRTLLLTIATLLSACNTLTPKALRAPSSESSLSGNAATLIYITESRLKSYIQELITTNSVLTEVYGLRIYPKYNLITVGTKLKLPKKFIPTFANNNLSEEKNEIVDLDLEIALQPSIDQQNEHSILKLKIISVDVNGMDFSRQIGIIPQIDKFIFLIISQTPLRNWMDQTKLPVAGTNYTLAQVGQLFSDLSSQKTFSIENNDGLATVSIQLVNLKNIATDSLKPSLELSRLFENYKVWHLGTQNLSPFNQPAITILTGEGQPNQKQLSEYKSQNPYQEQIETDLSLETNLVNLKTKLNTEMKSRVDKSALDEKDKSYIQSQLQSQIQSEIERKKILIFANYQEYSEKLQNNFSILTDQAVSYQIKQKQTSSIEDNKSSQTNSGFLTSKIISEDFLTNQLRYLKNLFTFQNEPLFSRLDVKLYPDQNVVRLQGRFFTATLLKLITKEFIKDALIDPKSYGKSIPFYFDFRISMEKIGTLKLTPLKFSLLDGEKAFAITAYHKNSQIIFDLVENLLLSAIPELIINIPQITHLNELTLAKPDSIKQQQKTIIDRLKNATETDRLLKNYSQSKKLFYQNKLNLDLSSEKVKSNLVNLISKHQNYYLIPVGTQVLDQLGLKLPIKNQYLASFELLDSKTNLSKNSALKITFTDSLTIKPPRSVSEHKLLGNSDLHILVNLNELSSNINSLLGTATLATQAQLKKQQEKEIEYDEFIFNSLNLKPEDDQENILVGSGTLSRERFQKKNILARAFGSKFKSESDRIEISFKVKLSAEDNRDESFKEDLLKYERNLSDLNSHIRVELISVGLKSSEHSDLLSLTKIAGINMDEVDLKKAKWIVRILKKPIFNALRRVFDSQDEGNTKLGKLNLNKLLRVIFLKDDLALVLNPRLSGPDIETDLLTKSDNLKNLNISAANGSLNVLLKTYVGFNSHDEEDIIDLIENLKSYKTSIQNIKTTLQLKEYLNKQNLYNLLVHNKNSFQSAYYKYLFQKLSQFPALVQILRTNTNEPENSDGNNSIRLLSMTGLELVYFATAFSELNDVLDLFQSKLISLNAAEEIKNIVSLAEQNDLNKKIQYINQIILPALSHEYKVKYQPHNQKELSSERITDWNENYILDMTLAESLFKILKPPLR